MTHDSRIWVLCSALGLAVGSCATAHGPLEVVLRGRVVDEARRPVAGAMVLAPVTGVGAATNDSGLFVIAATLPRGPTVLRAMQIGFAPTERSVRVGKAGTISLGLLVLRQRALPMEIDSVTTVPGVECPRVTDAVGITPIDSQPFNHPPRTGVLWRLAVATGHGIDTIPGVWTATLAVRAPDASVNGLAFDSTGERLFGFRYVPLPRRLDTLALPAGMAQGPTAGALSPTATFFAYVRVGPEAQARGVVGVWSCPHCSASETPVVVMDASRAPDVCWVDRETVRIEVPQPGNREAVFVSGRDSEWRVWLR